MSQSNTAHLDIVQIAYHVTDVREAAARMHRQFGAGPFILSENILLESAEHRGVAIDCVHTSASVCYNHLPLPTVRTDLYCVDAV